MKNDQYDELKIMLRDPDKQLIKMIDYIMHTANVGHSFEVVVDPDMSENRMSFFMDGDGSFFIKDVTLNGKKVKIKDNKLIENYLDNLQEQKKNIE